MDDKNIVNIGQEKQPAIFSTPRFTFPFSLVGRPLQDLGRKPVSEIQWDRYVYTNRDCIIRDEFFGAIVYKDVGADEGKFGYIRYINRTGREILRWCDGTRTVRQLTGEAARHLEITPEECAHYISQCTSAGIIDLYDARQQETGETVHPPLSSPSLHRLFAPLRLYVNITKRCNMNCTHCYAKLDEKTIELDRNTIDKVTGEIEKLKIPSVVLIGGEPLLAKDFPGIVKNMRQRKISCFTATNGLALNADYIRRLLDAGLRVIAISVDGPNAPKNNKIRGKGMFERTVANIRKSVEMGLDVSVSITLTEETIEDIDEFVQLGMDNGVCDFHIMLFAPVGRGEGLFSKVPQLPRVFKLKEKLQFYMSAYPGITFNCTGITHNRLLREWHQRFSGSSIARYIYSGCEAGRFRYEVGFDGSYIPCVLLDYNAFRVGHVKNISLKESWDRLPHMQQETRFNDRQLQGRCRGCDVYVECLGGCRGIAYARYKDLHHPDPTCSLRR